MSDKAALDADNVRLAVAIAPVVLANKDVILANKDKVPGWATKADGTPRLHIPCTIYILPLLILSFPYFISRITVPPRCRLYLQTCLVGHTCSCTINRRPPFLGYSPAFGYSRFLFMLSCTPPPIKKATNYVQRKQLNFKVLLYVYISLHLYSSPCSIGRIGRCQPRSGHGGFLCCHRYGFCQS